MLLLTAEPITYFQAIMLGLLQGFSELFPISSLGHSVILPQLLGWDIHQNDEYFITFLIATHLATAIVLFVFFLSDWMRIFAGMWRSLVERQIAPDNPDAQARLAAGGGHGPGRAAGPAAPGLAAHGVRIGASRRRSS